MLLGCGPLVINPDVSTAAEAVIFNASSVLFLWRLTLLVVSRQWSRMEDPLKMTAATSVEMSIVLTRSRPNSTDNSFTEVDSVRETFNVMINTETSG